MKKILIALMVVASLYANEIQHFTANTMHIKFNGEGKQVLLAYGTKEDIVKQMKDLANNEKNKKALVEAGIYTANGIAKVSNNLSSGQGTVAGLVAGAVLVGGIKLYDNIIEDNMYYAISLADNKENEKTMLRTVIIANDSIDKTDLKKLANKIQNNYIKGH